MIHIYKYRYDTCWPKRASTWQSCELKKGKPNSARFWPQNAGRVDESILRWTFFKKLVWTQNVRLASTRTMFLRNHGTVKDPSGCICRFVFLYLSWDAGNYSSQKRAYAPSSGNYPAAGALSGLLMGSQHRSTRSPFPGENDVPSGNDYITVCSWKWPFTVDWPIKNGDFLHSSVNVDQRLDLVYSGQQECW